MFKQFQAEMKRMLYYFIIHPTPKEAEQSDIHLDDYKKYKELERSFGEVSDLGLSNNEMMELIKQWLNELKQSLMNWQGEEHNPNAQHTEHGNLEENDGVSEGDMTIGDPKIANNHGRPRENRYKSSREIKRKVFLMEAEAMEAMEEEGVEDED
ncbi:hypothetical protein GH714_033091 [Hevea brasiliensis]|uniref:Uncharacterized protein n=1 Tax=Hevea brasiliensis TaxID=3981 RepID=A0A6A6LVL8_HEVBR|nr:hypothetical protein GH714_033091 [Hevea brasiliensis]